MKVGIMSMQRIYNYGSFLQAYGLKALLEEMGCEVKFVDYHPGECLLNDQREGRLKRSLKKGFQAFFQGASFKQSFDFIQFKRNFGKKYCKELGLNIERNYSSALDVLLIGSDEVFNCVQNNENVGFSLDLFGVGNQAKKLISYAASFGNTTLADLKKYQVEDVLTEALKKFNAISVRDENSKRIIKSLLNMVPEEHLDPVLIYDFLGKEQLPIISKKERYLILYGYSGRFSTAECRMVREFARVKKVKIYCIGGIQKVCDRFINCAPLEVLSYFLNADYVVTDTFHGCIFSIITHRQFAAFCRFSGYGNSQKLIDLLRKARLEDRLITDYATLRNKLETPIDYLVTDEFICKEKMRTYDYLRKNIVDQAL